MASKHLKQTNTKPPKEPKASTAPKHQKPAPAKEKKPPKEKPVKEKPAKEKKPKQAPAAESSPAQAPVPEEKVPEPKPPKAPKEKAPKKKRRGKQAPAEGDAHAPSAPMDFRQEQTEEEKALHRAAVKRDARRAAIALAIAAVFMAAVLVVWLYRDRFQTDDLIITSGSAAVAQEEYLFDAGSGQVFAAAGKGLALATSSGLELMDENGQIVTSKVFQMETPAIAACADFAVFYDLGGTNIAVAQFDGTVKELTAEGTIFSVTVSSGGYIAVTTECTGYRGLVTVYAPTLDAVYQWYSSSAWIISAEVSPDNKKMAVLSYTASGSEVRFFSLSQTDQLASFSVSDTILLDVHWFTSSQLCAYSTSQALFLNASGQWLDTYSFADQYLTGCTFGGDGFVTFSLSPYRVGTTSTLVSLDAGGRVLGTTEVQSEIISLTASGTEVLVLCSDGATLYNSSLSQKGQLTGLPGFKYGLLRDRGEALLIASNYAEVYTF